MVRLVEKSPCLPQGRFRLSPLLDFFLAQIIGDPGTRCWTAYSIVAPGWGAWIPLHAVPPAGPNAMTLPVVSAVTQSDEDAHETLVSLSPRMYSFVHDSPLFFDTKTLPALSTATHVELPVQVPQSSLSCRRCRV